MGLGGTDRQATVIWKQCREIFAGTFFALTTIRSRQIQGQRSLILLLVGALPTWPYSSGWGYYPSGGLGLVLIIFIVLLLLGRIAI